MSHWIVHELDDARVAALRPEAGVRLRGAGWAGGLELIATAPIAVLEQDAGRPARLRVGDAVVAEHPSGWTLWTQVHRELRTPAPCPLPLGPGWIGCVGFEAARLLERLPGRTRDPLSMPLLRLGLYDTVIVVDRDRGQAWRVEAPHAKRKIEERSSKSEAGPAVACTRDGRRAAHRQRNMRPTGEDFALRCSNFDLRGPQLTADFSQHDYEQLIARALEYIRAGDVYQVNLAQRFVIDPVPDPAALFERLQRVNPAPYAALIRWDDRAVVSASPELMLECRRGRLRTCPIKGTRPRTGDPARDRAAVRELLASEKEAAELTMIVDLHRNDFGRVCRTGSVQVASARRLEAHPTVYHTVAEVVGELRSDCDAIDALAACFPAGSVTGVPKIRALEIIDELEPVARGAYCGAIGHLGLDGDCTFNVAIRTLQLRAARATLYVGGGIVVESDPAAEYAETLAKARGILAALGVEPPQAVVATETMNTDRLSAPRVAKEEGHPAGRRVTRSQGRKVTRAGG